jgi:ParB family chromosome partitioning protein
MAKKTSLAKTPRLMAGNRPQNMEELIKAVQEDGIVPAEGQQRLPIERLKRGPYQPRQSFINDEADAELIELADSIRTVGLIEPIAVRPVPGGGGDYEILAGDRRWRAARLAGLTTVPVVVHTVDELTAAAIALVENLQRQDLNALEEAAAMQRLIDDFDLTQVQVGKLLSKSKSLISKTLALLSLSEEVRGLLRENRLTPGHARLLVNLDERIQITLARQAVEDGWSVRELERRKASLTSQVKSLPRVVVQDPDLRRLQVRMGEWLAAPVSLRTRKDGGGSIVIRFTTAEECAGILEKIGFQFND